MKKILVLDVESTTKAKGHPFHKDNKLCLVGLYDGNTYFEYDIEYSDSPYGSELLEIKKKIEEADILVGFNIKFDLHWLRRYMDVRFPSIFDCQLASFILSNQTAVLTSLDKECVRRGLSGKSGNAVHELWADGWDTPAIDRSLLTEYLRNDCLLTYQLYLKLQEEIQPHQKNLIKLHNADLLVLEDMEFNGFKIDLTLCKELDERFCKEIECLNDSIKHYYPHPDFNSGSNHQLSCLLFGGTYEYVCQVPTARTLKSGAIKTGFKKGTGRIPLTGMFKPKRDWEYKATKDKSDYDLYLENQRRAADGKQLLQRIYSTDYEVMQSLKSQAKSREAKAFIDMLLRKAYLEKLQSTYFGGYPKLVEQYGWSDGRIHGQFNQTIAITGRLSSSNPNLQNIAKEVKQVFRSEY
jgi:DNA polymerase I-like protein with 3'-5' exonuclease and polymerase domains